MKVICTQENFKGAILNSERMVSKQNTLPILNNILVEAEKGGLKFSATNLEIGIISKIGAKIEKEGKITIPSRLLSGFVSNLSGAGDNKIILEAEKTGLKIKSTGAKILVKGLPATDFPLIPQKTGGFQLFLSGGKIKDAIIKTAGCVAVNEARQELTGINLILSEKELFLAATDSFRLAECRIELKPENTDPEAYKKLLNKKESLIIPANTLHELVRIINNNEALNADNKVKIAIEESQIFFEIDGTKIVSRLIAGKYPEYKHIMPKEFKTRAVMDKKSVLGAVKMASIFTLGKTGETKIKIDSEAGKIICEAKNVEAGEGLAELKIDAVGPSQEAIFNSRYLLDGLNNISTSQVALLVNSGSSPAAIREINEKTGEVLGDYTYIVMPIKN